MSDNPYKYDHDLYEQNKVCPILSIGMIRFNGTIAKCVGRDCMWFGECDRKQIKELHGTKLKDCHWE